MGNKSSKYVNRFENRLQIESLQRQLDVLQNNINELKKDNGNVAKKQIAECKSLTDTSQCQMKKFIHIEHELQAMKKEIGRVDVVEDLKTFLNDVDSQHKDDRAKLASLIKKVIESERHNWDVKVGDLQERFNTVKEYSMELVSVNLSHERELRLQQKRIKCLEDKLLFPRDDLAIMNSSFESSEETRSPSSYDLKFTRIDGAIRRLKRDLEIADLN